MLRRIGLLCSFSIVAVVACGKRQPAPAAPPPPAAVTPAAPPVDPQAEAAARVARGEYVATISGCMVCHTPMRAGEPDMDRLLAGGLEVKTAAGKTWRSPNITPDRETGIGDWTDAQIIAAIRQGIRHDGVKLLPVMPYPYYHRMTDADARDVVAYLRAQRPVVNRVALSDRLVMSPVELGAPAGNVDPKGDPKAHGEYLANLMHCGACHTPHEGTYANMAGVGGVAFPMPDGSMIHSANITSDERNGIGRWTEEQIIAAVRTMRKADGSRIEGPMAMYRDAWSQLTDEDARALAVFIKAIPPVPNDVPERQPAVTRAP